MNKVSNFTQFLKNYKKIMNKNIGLFFGSFNPIHIGHLIIAEAVSFLPFVHEIWFVISPQNPFKNLKGLLNQYDRLHLVKLAIDGNTKFKTCTAEFDLPKPSYTIDTLTYLSEKNPTYNWHIIMGEDNLEHFDKWKNAEAILKYHHLIIYPRPNYLCTKYNNHSKVTRLSELPLIQISSTYIRQAIVENKSYRYMLPLNVYNYLTEMNLYKKL